MIARGRLAGLLVVAGCASDPAAPRDGGLAADARGDALLVSRDVPVASSDVSSAPPDVLADASVVSPGLVPWRRAGGRFVRDEAMEAVLRAGEGWTALQGSPREVTSVFSTDLDGDGRDELVLSVVRDLYNPNRSTGSSWIARRDEAGRWSVARNLEAMGACRAAADFDQDGDPDLLCVGEVAAVFWNERGRFDGARATTLPIEGVAMSALPRDLDEDGLLDIVIGNWERGTMQALQNVGGGRFADVSARWGLALAGMTWAVAAVDFDEDGREDLLTMGEGDAHENRAMRSLGPGADGAPRFERVRPSLDPDEAERWFGTTNVGPMGAALGWLDGDARPDLVLASDFYNGPGLPILSARAAGDWRAISSRLSLATELSDSGSGLVPWSPRIWDIDHDGRAELLVPCGDDLGHAKQPNRGNSRVLLFRAVAHGALYDIADDLLPTRGQFMTPSLVDLDGDDDLDLVLGGFGQPWQVFRNEVEALGGHTFLRLTGRTSNADALGARVAVDVAGVTQRWVYGDVASPQAIEHGPIDVALGAAPAIDALTVRWPSGYTQTLRGAPRARRIELVEPSLVAVEPASRHAPADGVATVTVTVRPADPAGAPRRADVRITAPYHPEAAWVGAEETLADGAVRRSLRAPRSAGSVVVAVTIDGTALSVRPRVWFDAVTP